MEEVGKAEASTLGSSSRINEGVLSQFGVFRLVQVYNINVDVELAQLKAAYARERE